MARKYFGGKDTGLAQKKADGTPDVCIQVIVLLLKALQRVYILSDNLHGRFVAVA